MSDRELITQDIYQAWADWESVTHDAGEVVSWPDEAADAVLAVIGDRLLPELPEGWRIDFVEWERYERIKSQYVARVARIDDDDKYRDGTGPTIPAAIRDAMEGE